MTGKGDSVSGGDVPKGGPNKIMKGENFVKNTNVPDEGSGGCHTEIYGQLKKRANI